jgi:hypothetical protein
VRKTRWTSGSADSIDTSFWAGANDRTFSCVRVLRADPFPQPPRTKTCAREEETEPRPISIPSRTANCSNGKESDPTPVSVRGRSLRKLSASGPGAKRPGRALGTSFADQLPGAVPALDRRLADCRGRRRPRANASASAVPHSSDEAENPPHVGTVDGLTGCTGSPSRVGRTAHRRVKPSEFPGESAGPHLVFSMFD